MLIGTGCLGHDLEKTAYLPECLQSVWTEGYGVIGNMPAIELLL